ncbi:unnamed protein product [Linum tenue]|uniref:Uncharacterized protein n=1 Tax=Linum tenue TaxID=586396 RepID=A0AAV0KNX2_9ROSI|nr:unnamed protein product [Linum tenue]
MHSPPTHFGSQEGPCPHPQRQPRQRVSRHSSVHRRVLARRRQACLPPLRSIPKIPSPILGP